MSTTNSVTELCELVVRVKAAPDQDGELDCLVELRLALGDIELEDETCEISISKLTIALDLEGVSEVLGSRYGEPRKMPVEMERTVIQTNTSGKSFKASGAAKIDMTGPALGASISGDAEIGVRREATLRAQDTFLHQHVTAAPNLRWEVREHDDGVLRGTYLDGQRLLRVTRAERANRSALIARATVKQKDVSIDQVVHSALALRFFRRPDVTRRRLMDIFIKKTLDAAIRGGGKFAGQIVLSKAEIDLADED